MPAVGPVLGLVLETDTVTATNTDTAEVTASSQAGQQAVVVVSSSIASTAPSTTLSSRTTRKLSNADAEQEEGSFANKNIVCLVCFEGSVLDVAGFLAMHPGGEKALLRHAGKDITAIFRKIGHSQKALTLLAQYRVCSLIEWEVKYNAPFICDKPRIAMELEGCATLATTTTSTTATSATSASDGGSGSGPAYHHRRRAAMLSSHPEIEGLYGPSLVPLLYMPVCLAAFMYVGAIAGTELSWPGHEYLRSPLASVLVAWIVLPFLGFGLNNAHHEICHGNTPLTPVLASVTVQCPSLSGGNLLHYFSALLTKLVLLVNGVVTLNHFLFYYYWHSHLSHHRALGNGSDRGHAFRSLYATPRGSRKEAHRDERYWAVDGDLFGLHPEFLVRDTIDTMTSIFVLPDASLLSPRLCVCYPFLQRASVSSPLRGIARFLSLSMLFVTLRLLGDVWTVVNTLVINAVCIPLGARRPFDVDMFVSGLLLIGCHCLWIYFAGMRSWALVYASSFSQPTHAPASIYFGYFAGIHAGVASGSATGAGDASSSRSSRSSRADGTHNSSNDTFNNSSSSSSNTNSNGSDNPEALEKGLGKDSDSGLNVCQITVSNYSPLMRFLTLDQCLHLEHHDFPSIPCHRLGRLRHIAPEWYACGGRGDKERERKSSHPLSVGGNDGTTITAAPTTTTTTTTTTPPPPPTSTTTTTPPPTATTAATVGEGVAKRHTWFLEPWLDVLLSPLPPAYASCE
jgi:cytochrome b involved in lipid metabolism